MDTLVSEPIEVTCAGAPQVPASFAWRGQEFVVSKVEGYWHDWGFGKAAPKTRTWKLRRHRNYYRVVTTCGRRFELYLDRGGGRRIWVLFKEILDA